MLLLLLLLLVLHPRPRMPLLALLAGVLAHPYTPVLLPGVTRQVAAAGRGALTELWSSSVHACMHACMLDDMHDFDALALAVEQALRGVSSMRLLDSICNHTHTHTHTRARAHACMHACMHVSMQCNVMAAS
jgi:hypothetical protein